MAVTRGARFRSKVVFVRLSEEEYAKLAGAAGWAPLATWARRTLLATLDAAQPKRRAAR
jgi:hypothetical protein